MKKYNRFIYTFFLTFIGLVALRYLAALSVIHGKNIAESGYLMSAIYACKDVLARNADTDNKPRIIIIAGSNGLYGINNSVIEKQTGLKVINMSSHAGLPLDYLMYRALKYVKKGDIVVLPLEYAYYGRDGYEEWAMHNLFYWGKSFLNNLSVWDKFPYLIRIPNDVFIKQLTANTLPKDEKLVASGMCQFAKNEINFSSFGSSYLKDDGTYISGNKNIYTEDKQYNFVTRDFRLKQIAEYKTIIEKKEARFFLTYPAMMKNKLFDLNDEMIRRSIRTFQESLARYGLYLNCRPEDSFFQREFFFDTEYHLTNQGAMKRSNNLGRCLQQAFSLSPKKNFSKTNDFSVELLSGFAHPEDSLVWTDGQTAQLSIYFYENTKDMKLLFDMIPFVVPQQPKLKVDIFIGNKKIKTWNFDYERSVPETELQISSENLKKNNSLIITFKFSNNKSPKELGINGDSRILNLGFKSLKIF